MRKIIEILFILYIMFIGSDRINLLPNNIYDFQFTPYILISLILLLFIFLFKSEDINFDWLKNNRYFLNSLIIFLLFVLVSVLFSIDIYYSFKRYILLLYIIIFSIISLSSFNKSKIIDIYP